MTGSSDNRLLIVDDDPGIRTFLGAVADRLGFEVHTLAGAQRFVETVREVAPQTIILDLNLPDCDGVELFRRLAVVQSEARIILISGEDERVLDAAKRLGSSQGLCIDDSLQKPVMMRDLEFALRKSLSTTLSESDLASAIRHGELLLHYQPKLVVDDNGIWSIGGAEALVRWQHEEHGLLMPDQFIPLAEQSGLIGELTEMVIREALQQLSEWSGRGLITNVAINVPPQLLSDVEFPDRLAWTMQHHAVEGDRITLEVTESAATTNTEAMMDTLVRLRLKGIALSIDDFGTGYSSMKQLFDMPFTELKIDRSFVTEIPTSSDARMMVKTMIQLAENLGMTACAEGVESQEVLDFLELSGCHSVQGFFICKPVQHDEFEEFLHLWKDGGCQRLIEMGRH